LSGNDFSGYFGFGDAALGHLGVVHKRGSGAKTARSRRTLARETENHKAEEGGLSGFQALATG